MVFSAYDKRLQNSLQITATLFLKCRRKDIGIYLCISCQFEQIFLQDLCHSFCHHFHLCSSRSTTKSTDPCDSGAGGAEVSPSSAAVVVGDDV